MVAALTPRIDQLSPNLIRNGSFNFWQRGTSFGSVNVYSADRWYFFSGPTASCTQQTSGLTNTSLCMRLQTTGTGSTAGAAYTMESIDVLPLLGKYVTLSFKARKSSTATTSTVALTLAKTTAVNTKIVNSPVALATLNPILTTSWQTFTVPSVLIPTDGSANGLGLYFIYSATGTSGGSDYVEIAEVMMNIGTVAAPFALFGGSYDNELRACQRYCYRPGWNEATDTYYFFGVGQVYGANAAGIIMPIPVELRAKPTNSNLSFANLIISTAAFGGVAVSGLTFHDSGYQSVGFTVATSSGSITPGYATTLGRNGNASGFIQIDVEL